MRKNCVVIALAVLASPAFAINMSGFSDAPITRLNADEVREFRAAVIKALDSTPDGKTVEWKAPKTRFVSKITPGKSFADGDQKCRDATIESDAHDRFQRGVYTFCKAAGGEWGFAAPRSRPAAK